jgi:hypothetical protein
LCSDPVLKATRDRDIAYEYRVVEVCVDGANLDVEVDDRRAIAVAR